MATPSISGSDGIQPSDAAPAYAVGYGRPPVHTRFKPGHPGRGGRPKGQRNMRTVMEGFLKEPVTVREGNRQRKMSKRDAMILRIVNEAVSGNDKAQAKVIAMAMTETAEAINQEPFTADDPAVIADFLRRLGNPAPPTQPPERNANPEAGAAKPARSEASKVMNMDPQLLAAILRNDLYSFIAAVFPIVSPNDAFAHNWHIEAIAYALTRVYKGEVKRLIITVPPRSLKSICTSVAFPAYILGHDPRRRIICVSYSEGLARKHANDCRAVMHSPLYTRLFPNSRISRTKDTELEFATTLGGNRLATSVGGTLTGRGGNLIIIDDAMKPQDACSEAARESNKQWYANTLLTRLDNKTRDSIVVVMQRLHVDDLVGHLLEQEGWVHLNLPAIAECDQRIALSAERFHLRQPGELLHPEREPQSVLQEFKRSMGSLAFAAQYQQEPIAEGGNLVKWHWFKVYDQPPTRTSGDRIIVSWDTALSAKDLASFSACVVLQVRGETAYVLDVFRERLEYPDLKRKVVELHKRWRYAANDYALAIENKGSGMSLIQDLQDEHIHAIAVDPAGDKVMRMNEQTARIEAGSVSLPKQAPWLDEFRREILAFPAGRYSDQVDAFSQALNRAYNRRDGEFSWGYLQGLN